MCRAIDEFEILTEKSGSRRRRTSILSAMQAPFYRCRWGALLLALAVFSEWRTRRHEHSREPNPAMSAQLRAADVTNPFSIGGSRRGWRTSSAIRGEHPEAVLADFTNLSHCARSESTTSPLSTAASSNSGTSNAWATTSSRLRHRTQSGDRMKRVLRALSWARQQPCGTPVTRDHRQSVAPGFAVCRSEQHFEGRCRRTISRRERSPA